MPKKRRPLSDYILLASGAFLIFSVLICCSGIHFPFIAPRYFLNQHLERDFHLSLPPSAIIDNAEWTGTRDPEHVFALHMPPADISPFLKALPPFPPKEAEGDTPTLQIHPLYPRSWWNTPPIADRVGFKIRTFHQEACYGILYSPTTGKMYIVWDEF